MDHLRRAREGPMIPPAVDRIGLRITPVVFAALFGLGVWADPVDLFGLPSGWVVRVVFAVACATSLAAAVRPHPVVRMVAFSCGMGATVGRGVTILALGQDVLLRKSELIGGSVWMIAGWMVFAVWVLTVPAAARWQK